jgi:hypothetical protein
MSVTATDLFNDIIKLAVLKLAVLEDNQLLGCLVRLCALLFP